ncbi:MAG: hypothetical protein Q4G39_07195 [Brachymonas sp.]|nr:hypothetical protein [Brachymonas sp.]
MRRLCVLFSIVVISALLSACNQQPATSAPATTAALPENTSPPVGGNLPVASFTDAQLQERWNRLANTMQMEKLVLHNCQPVPAPSGQSITRCHSAAKSVVYFVRTADKVTQVQFTSIIGMFSVKLDEIVKFMVRYLHDGTHGDDITLHRQFIENASNNKKFCVPSPVTQSQMCYLLGDNSYGVEIR